MCNYTVKQPFLLPLLTGSTNTLQIQTEVQTTTGKQPHKHGAVPPPSPVLPIPCSTAGHPGSAA